MGKMTFVAGFAVGYVLGAKAGRERYEQLMRAAQKVRANPTVQEAAGLVQAQTSRLMSTGTEAVKTTMNRRLGHTRIGQRLLGDRAGVTLQERPDAPRPSHF